jgi:predicted peptidase
MRSSLVARGFLFASLSVGDRAYPYALYVPRAYRSSRRWPLILFLHGRGECGRDGSRQLSEGIAGAIVEEPARWPFLVVLPQKPDGSSEWEEHEPALLAMLAGCRRNYRVDDRRLYLTGLSQGGHGAWVLAARHPELWAAVAPICGYGRSPGRRRQAGGSPPYRGSPDELAAALHGLPVWAFHGEADDAVPVAQTTTLVAAVTAAGGAPRMTIYPGVGHNCWDLAYRSETLPEWFLSHRTRPGRAPAVG